MPGWLIERCSWLMMDDGWYWWRQDWIIMFGFLSNRNLWLKVETNPRARENCVASCNHMRSSLSFRSMLPICHGKKSRKTRWRRISLQSGIFLSEVDLTFQACCLVHWNGEHAIWHPSPEWFHFDKTCIFQRFFVFFLTNDLNCQERRQFHEEIEAGVSMLPDDP